MAESDSIIHERKILFTLEGEPKLLSYEAERGKIRRNGEEFYEETNRLYNLQAAIDFINSFSIA